MIVVSATPAWGKPDPVAEDVAPAAYTGREAERKVAKEPMAVVLFLALIQRDDDCLEGFCQERKITEPR